MTLPNWVIRSIVIAACPVLFPWAAFEGAWNCVSDELWPHIKEAWKHPEDTRWGKNRCKQ